MPERTPLNPVITGRVDRGDYTVENVSIETRLAITSTAIFTGPS